MQFPLAAAAARGNCTTALLRSRKACAPWVVWQAKLLAGLAFTSALRVGLQRHPMGDSGRLPRPPALTSSTAAPAGKAFLALALRGSAPSGARPAPYGAAKTPCPPPYRGREAGHCPQRAFAGPVALRASGLSVKTRRLPHQALPPGPRLRPRFAISGRLSASLPVCGRRCQAAPRRYAGLAFIFKRVSHFGLVKGVVVRCFFLSRSVFCVALEGGEKTVHAILHRSNSQHSVVAFP